MIRKRLSLSSHVISVFDYVPHGLLLNKLQMRSIGRRYLIKYHSFFIKCLLHFRLHFPNTSSNDLKLNTEENQQIIFLPTIIAHLVFINIDYCTPSIITVNVVWITNKISRTVQFIWYAYTLYKNSICYSYSKV